MQQKQGHWKHKAIEKSGLLSDLWDVFISFAGRGAGWVLFACMLCNILQVIPGIVLPPFLISAVLAVEIVTLDIAGFGLNTIAKHVLKHSVDHDAQQTAHGAKKLATCLIGLMIVTVLLITIGALYAAAKPYTDIIDKVLILGRIVLIVIYMHCMHDLRQVELELDHINNQTGQANDQLALDNQARIAELAQVLARLQESSELVKQSLQTELATIRESLQQQIGESSGHLQRELASIRQELAVTRDLQALAGQLQQQQQSDHDHLQVFSGQLQQAQETMRRELHQAVQALNKQLLQVQERAQAPAQASSRATLHALPSVRPAQDQPARTLRTRETQTPSQAALPAPEQGKFDARAFVAACLERDQTLKLTDIQQLARLQGQELSEATISRYRKQYFASRESSASSDESLQVVENESSVLQGESLQAVNE